MENETIGFTRSSSISAMIGQRGSFSLRRGGASQSEIPRNTLSIQPSDALFRRHGCCNWECYRFRRFFRRHKKLLWTCLSAIACASAFILLVGSFTYHLHRRFSSSSNDKTFDVADDVVYDEVFRGTTKDKIEDVGHHMEALSPLQGESLRHRVPVEVLLDSREVDDLFNIERGSLVDELTRAKRRYRRSLPNYNPQSKLLKKFVIPDDNEPIRSKLDALLNEIRDISEKMKTYEANLSKQTRTFFRDYSLQYPSSKKPNQIDSTTKSPADQQYSDNVASIETEVLEPNDPLLNDFSTTEVSFETLQPETSTLSSGASSDITELLEPNDPLLSDFSTTKMSQPPQTETSSLSSAGTSGDLGDTTEVTPRGIDDSSSTLKESDLTTTEGLFSSTLMHMISDQSLPSSIESDPGKNSDSSTVTSPHTTINDFSPSAQENDVSSHSTVYNSLKESDLVDSTGIPNFLTSLKQNYSITEYGLNNTLMSSTETVFQENEFSTTEKGNSETSEDYSSESELPDHGYSPVTFIESNTNVLTVKDVSLNSNTSDVRLSTEQYPDETVADGSIESVASNGTPRSFESDTNVSTVRDVSLNSNTSDVRLSTEQYPDETVADGSIESVASDGPPRSFESNANVSTVRDVSLNSNTSELRLSTEQYPDETVADGSLESVASDGPPRKFDENYMSRSPKYVTEADHNISENGETYEETFTTIQSNFSQEKHSKENDEIDIGFNDTTGQTFSSELKHINYEVTSDPTTSLLGDDKKSTPISDEKLEINSKPSSTASTISDNYTSETHRQGLDVFPEMPSSEPGPASDFTSSDENVDILKHSTDMETTTSYGSSTESYEVKSEEKGMTSGNISETSENSLFEGEPTSSESSQASLLDLNISDTLEKEILPKFNGKDESNAQKSSNGDEENVHGISLLEAQTRKLTDGGLKKWDSKVISSSNDVTVPTGPDHTVGMGEALNTGQQVSYSPSAPSHFMMPYQMCFFGTPQMKGFPSIRAEKDNLAKTAQLSPLNVPSFVQFGVNIPTSTPTSTPSSANLPQQNFFNFIMNNNNPGYPSPSAVNSPFFHPYFPPPQQLGSKYFHSQNVPIFCSVVQAPSYQFPTFPGTAEYNGAKCINCNDTTFSERAHENPAIRNSERGSLICPEGTSRCKDDLLCIPSQQWCDGRVHCSDASDELFCSCRDRVADSRHCDGYLDCPKGEDEIACFGCPLASFSCGTWDQSSSCISINKRCDGQNDCPNGLDEIGCSIISPSLFNVSDQAPVSFEEGFLLRNWHGNWYPVCVEKRRQLWAEQACSEFSDDIGDIDFHQVDVPENYKGLFLTHLDDLNFVVQHHCKGHTAVHIRCPSAKCGTRAASDENNGNDADFVSRFRRLVEEGESPRPADESFVKWWELMKDRVEKRFNVKDVMAHIVPLGDVSRKKRHDDLRVVGGASSLPRDWPWAIALMRDGVFHCGGVVLDPYWVMTAAHCVIKFEKHYYQIRAGMLRRFSFSPMEQSRTITYISVNERYEERTMKNDVALLRLNEPLKFNLWVRPICLPVPKNDDQNSLPGPVPGSYCVAVGWGALKEHGPDPDQLREVVLPILSRCKHKDDIEGKEICAGYKLGGKDTCQGDSGGPLMCKDTTKKAAWYLAGVVSHGDGCARPDEAGAYTRVGLYVDWLAKQTRDYTARKTNTVSSCPGFQCRSHPYLCIPRHLRCNSIVDCLEAEDEKDCPTNRYDVADGDFLTKSSRSRKRENSPTDISFFDYSSPQNFISPFRCKSIVQTIPGGRLCDGIRDCEDASDERSCTCRDRISKDAICNGIIDCADGSDEESCFQCPEDYFNCRRSRQCLLISKRCDGVTDCTLEEDEKNCLALSKVNNTLILDKFGNPSYETNGVLFKNTRGVWKLSCLKEVDRARTRLQTKVCDELGLIGFESYEYIPMKNVKLRKNGGSSGNLFSINVGNLENCTSLHVTCSKFLAASDEPADDTVTWDWEANVRENGIVTCTSLILTSEWLLGSENCISNLRNISSTYLTAEIGFRVYPTIFIRIVAASLIANTNIVLMRLQNPVFVNRYTRPIEIPIWSDAGDLKSCSAIHGQKKITLEVRNDFSNNSPDHLSFSRSRRPSRGCRSDPWVGVIICSSAHGWLPTGVFNEPGGACGFQHTTINNVLSHISALKEITSEWELKTEPSFNDSLVSQEPDCIGKRCLGGLCISDEKMCDGQPDCPNADDESEEACTVQKNGCGWNELQCLNGACIHRSMFGDTIQNCLDGSDEPLNSSCASYLRLTAPHRICDGARNCWDKSDELICSCKNESYVCDSSKECIPKQFVCDGQKDCPHGEDELMCISLQKVLRKPKVYELRNMSYGIWHSVCDAELSVHEMDKLCRSAGHSIALSAETKLALPTIPVLDPFSDVKLNNLTRFSIRNDRPFVTLKLDKSPCLITFITCQ